MIRSKTYIAIPPGVTIKEQINDRGMSQKEFAIRMDMSEKHISKLINGEVQLSPDVAMRLEMVLGLPAHFWNNLENIYREKLIKIKAENDIETDKEIASKIPYNEMAKKGWVAETRIIAERIINLRQFFEVVNLQKLENPVICGIACRKLGTSEKSDYVLLTMAQKAKLEARNIQTGVINIDKLISILPNIRKMTKQKNADFRKTLIEMLASCGIALIILPHIGGSFLHGVTFYDGKKIVVGMTIRGKDADRFWFSLFHELGHIILGHIGQATGASERDEAAADTFAKDTLIPQAEYDSFIQNQAFDKSDIISFAEKINIDPGIVLGRLQKEQYLPFNRYTDLKTQYEF